MKHAVAVSLCVTALLAAAAQSFTPPQPAKMSPEKAEELRKKYSAGGFVRDINHIQEDLKHLIQYSGDGTFTVEESIFYLMRMHDFDDNNQLDGLELMRAFGHAHGHDASHNNNNNNDEDNIEPPLETLEQLVDETMQYDTNFDGMLSYAEWVKGYGK